MEIELKLIDKEKMKQLIPDNYTDGKDDMYLANAGRTFICDAIYYCEYHEKDTENNYREWAIAEKPRVKVKSKEEIQKLVDEKGYGIKSRIKFSDYNAKYCNKIYGIEQMGKTSGTIELTNLEYIDEDWVDIIVPKLDISTKFNNFLV